MKVIPNAGNENIKRINEIYQVLKKNDFGYLIEENTFLKDFHSSETVKPRKKAYFQMNQYL